MPKAGLKHHEPTTSLYRRGTWLFFLQEVFLQQVLHFRCKSRNPAGITFICKECERGSAQASGASVACEPCPFGQYADEPGSLSCKVCPVDWYQDQKGEHGCKRCPEGTGTRLLGSVSITDCGCYEKIHQHCSKWCISMRSLWGRCWIVRSHQPLSISHLLSPTWDRLLGSEVVGIRGCFFEVSTRLGWK